MPASIASGPYASQRAAARPIQVSCPWKESKVSRRSGQTISASRAPSAPRTARDPDRGERRRPAPRGRKRPTSHRTPAAAATAASDARYAKREPLGWSAWPPATTASQHRGSVGEQQTRERIPRAQERAREGDRDGDAERPRQPPPPGEVVARRRVRQEPGRGERVRRRGDRRHGRLLARDLEEDVVIRGAREVRRGTALVQQEERRGAEREARPERGRASDALREPAPRPPTGAGERARARRPRATRTGRRGPRAPRRARPRAPRPRSSPSARAPRGASRRPRSGASAIMTQAQRERIRCQRSPARISAASAPPPDGRSARPSSAAVTSDTAPASAEGKRTPNTVVPHSRSAAR